jgi:hypothetical protein
MILLSCPQCRSSAEIGRDDTDCDSYDARYYRCGDSFVVVIPMQYH